MYEVDWHGYNANILLMLLVELYMVNRQQLLFWMSKVDYPTSQ